MKSPKQIGRWQIFPVACIGYGEMRGVAVAVVGGNKGVVLPMSVSWQIPFCEAITTCFPIHSVPVGWPRREARGYCSTSLKTRTSRVSPEDSAEAGGLKESP
jgi:hypothetical protein